MRILVTLGGTSERIDQVRSITNHSTGELGNEIVSLLAKNKINVDVIASDSAIQPLQSTYVSVKTIHDTYELNETLVELMTHKPYDAVIHSMAVSDFTTQKSFSEEDFLTLVNTWVSEHPNKEMTGENLNNLLSISAKKSEPKISSSTDHLVLFLEKTPKVIQKIKKIQPKTLLVGFKLLVDVSKDELFSVAHKSLEKSQADYVLANDLSGITSSSHTGYLLSKTGTVGQADSKASIAELIVTEIQSVLSKKED